MLAVYLQALALTLAIETPLVAWLAPAGERRLVVCVALLLNLFSHPLACAAYWHGLAPLVALELLVVAVETLGFRIVARLGWRRALVVALVANAVTAGISFLF